jgi:hypothetical protein
VTVPRGARLFGPPLALAILATALLARQTLPVGFVGHDTYPVLFTSGDLGSELMAGRYTADFYRPVLNLSVAFDRAVHGLEPTGYQVTSVLLFGAGGFVVFLVARRLLGPGSLVGPLAAMALYLLHPTHIEVVPVVARRADLLCWFFAGIALALQPSIPGRTAVLAAVCGFLAMMSKEAGLLVPGLAFVTLFVLSESGGAGARGRAALRATLPLWIALGLALSIRLAVLGGIGGHGEAVRGASIDRIPSAMLAVWALLVEPQPVRAADVVGSPWVVLWSILFGAGLAFAAFGREARPALRAGAVAFLWLLALAATYALAGGIQAWYLLLPAASFSILLGAAVEGVATHRARFRTAVLLAAAVAILVLWHGRYSPLFLRYDAWDEATRAAAAYLEPLRSRVEGAAPGSTVDGGTLPDWIPVTPGAPSVRGASVLAPYSVEAWLELRLPGRALRVSSVPEDTPAPGEVLVRVARGASRR